MLTLGSVSREEACQTFDFLGEHVKGRRSLLKDFTHTQPDFVFWIYPDGRVHDARNAHRQNFPKGYQHILDDEPDYGGFLRGRVATKDNKQLIVVYCRSEALAMDAIKIKQFLTGVSQFPVPLDEDALVVSDNADIYGTLQDIEDRLENAAD
ncbi:MAG: hypothetical protein ACAI35_09145 [Candidatus Methylacidiphilales bacterium]